MTKDNDSDRLIVTNAEEVSGYEVGRRSALVGILNHVSRELGYSGTPGSMTDSWISEREQAIAILHSFCEDYGDNDWDEHLHLADIIDKHLERQVRDVNNRLVAQLHMARERIKELEKKMYGVLVAAGAEK